MSDTQDPLLLRQRQVQQRQILAMMGIGQWVQSNSPTMAIEIASYKEHTAQQSIEQQASENFEPTTSQPTTPEFANNNSQAPVELEENNTQDNIQFDDIESDVVASDNLVTSDSLSVEKPSNVEQALEPLINKVAAPIAANLVLEADNLEADDNNQKDSSLDKVAPFDLQGGRFGDWVLIVDIQALNNDSQKLWQNITQALSLNCETSSFPICVGMDTAELANASLAGYLFKIGRSEDIKVAALTELPEGLTHPNFADVPSLDEMLANSSLKRDLWQQISQ